MRSRSRRELGAALVAGVLAGAPATTRAHQPQPAIAPVVEQTPTWRFKHADRKVKVVVVAGSIGAWPKQPYAEEIERLCKNVEVKNLSQVGQGAGALKKRFKSQVLGNRRVNLRDESVEYWLLYGGGLNSVGTPTSTNKHMRDLFVIAHGNGFKVVGLSLTPWGDHSDRKWRGFEGLGRRRVTQHVVNYTLGRLSPAQALGQYAGKRTGGRTAPWDPMELPDVGIDLYDSALRDRDAAAHDFEATKLALAKDKKWKAAVAKLDDAARAAQLGLDAAVLAELPRWFLREDLRSFDHVHPNAEGHRIIAATMCPSLPASWGCTCEDAPPQTPEG